MQPDVSIIVPIFNTEKYLEQCLDSIRRQTHENIEVICVDDGCTDGSASIMDAAASEDKRIKVIHKHNEGYGKAVNIGIDASTGAYIGIVEPDDYIDEHMIEKLYEAASQHELPDIVKAAYWRVLEADSPNQSILPANYLHCVRYIDQAFQLKDDAEFLFHHPSIWTALYRFDFLKQHHIRMHEIPGAGWADNPWLIETLAQANSIVYIDECVYYYRETIPGSSSIVKDPSIIYDRWLDMDEIIKQLRVSDTLILEGHYKRGCAYLQMLFEGFDRNDASIKSAMHEMISRIDKKMIRQSNKIPAEYKAAYYEAKGGLDWFAFRLKRKLKML